MSMWLTRSSAVTHTLYMLYFGDDLPKSVELSELVEGRFTFMSSNEIDGLCAIFLKHP